MRFVPKNDAAPVTATTRGFVAGALTDPERDSARASVPRRGGCAPERVLRVRE